MIKEYNYKPKRVKAIRLDKSANSIEKVINFIFDSSQEIDSDYKMVLFNILASSKYLFINYKNETFKISCGNYIVKDEDSKIAVYTARKFKRDFDT